MPRLPVPKIAEVNVEEVQTDISNNIKTFHSIVRTAIGRRSAAEAKRQKDLESEVKQ